MEFIPRAQITRSLPDQGGPLPSWLRDLLVSRGYGTEEEMARFLKPEMDQLLDPMTLPGMRAFVDTLARLRREKGRPLRVTVYGDYDVDGICASVIMERAFQLQGDKTEVRIPDRHGDGYGLNMTAVSLIAGNADVLVTVDCGITSVEETALAKQSGLTVLITDHHTPGPVLPEADAVVDPMLAGEGYSPLCGAGVAWKVMWALNGLKAAEDVLDICALATVADLVPLQGENRVLVRHGLKAINSKPRTGISALLKCARIPEGSGSVTSDKIAYQLAPRLNAAGRLDSALKGYRLLKARDPAEAMALAEQLEDLNRERRAMEEKAFAQAKALVDGMPLWRQRGIVVFGPDWDTGVIGLVAGKLAEMYAYPAICLTKNLAGEYQGSGRSACGIDLYRAIAACRKYLTRFGGHRQAAGLALRPEDLDKFTAAFSEAVAEQLGEGDLRHAMEYDLELSLKDVNRDNVRLISYLEPFGMGNQRPVFRFNGCALSMRAVGAGGKHLKCEFSRDDEIRQGIWFSHGYLAGDALDTVDLLAEMTLNEFGGKVSAECTVRGLRTAPDGLRDDPARERAVCLEDLRTAEKCAHAAGENRVRTCSWRDAAPGHRGTLYLCRRASTAAAVAAAYPGLEVTGARGLDRRAYSAVALYAPIGAVPEGYDRIVLCDGSFGSAETAALSALYPGVEIIVSPSGTASQIRSSLLLSREELRGLYVLFRRWDEMGERGALREAGMDAARLKWGAAAMERVGLLELTDSPLSVRLLPRPQGATDPLATVWYHLTETGSIN